MPFSLHQLAAHELRTTVSVSNSEQSANAYLSMEVTLSGMLMRVRDSQEENDSSPMEVTPSGMLMLVRD